MAWWRGVRDHRQFVGSLSGDDVIPRVLLWQTAKQLRQARASQDGRYSQSGHHQLPYVGPRGEGSVSKETKDADTTLAKMQTLVLDALAPLVHILENPWHLREVMAAFLAIKCFTRDHRSVTINPAQNGQYECHHICEQVWGHNFTERDSHNQELMALVPADISHSGTPTRSTECDCKQGIVCDEGQDRLETEPRGVQADKQMTGSTSSGSVRISSHNSTPTILQLEARSGGGSPECVRPTVGQARREGICQSPVESGGENPVPCTSSKSNHSVDRSSVEDTGVVRNSPGAVDRLPCDTQASREVDAANSTNSGTRGRTSTSHMAYLRQHHKDEQISDAGTELLLVSWRIKSSKS